MSNLSPKQFSYAFTFVPSTQGEHHKVLAHHGEQRVGIMKWDPENGNVEDIQVHPEHRRRGVATGMWNFAQTHVRPQTPGLGYADDVIAPKHSVERTESGNAWAKSTGDKLPPLKKTSVREVLWK